MQRRNGHDPVRQGFGAHEKVVELRAAVRYGRAMTYEQLPDEWKDWLNLTPIERFRESEKIFAQYLAMGGTLDPDPDPTSPFYAPEEWRPDLAHGRAGLRLLRRGAS
ncbi:MAG: hypothetical protein ABMA13_04515 [Chthoniobacteraceae bacterium]